MARDLAEYHFFGMWLKFRILKSLMISELSTFLFLIDVSTEKETEWMMNLFELFVTTMLSAKFQWWIGKILLEDIFYRFYSWMLLHIQFCCFLWSHLYKCGSRYGIFLGCWRFFFDRLRSEGSFWWVWLGWRLSLVV